MAREVIHPKDEQHWLKLRTKDITSTDVAALFGISPYTTLFELWHRKKDGLVVDFEENERMKWGTRLQDAIAAGIAEDNGWEVRRMDEYIRGSALRVGSSFDFCIEEGMSIVGSEVVNGKNIPVSKLIEKGLLEIKNVDSLQFKQKWIENENGSLEAPLHIEIQVQHQLLVSGYSFAYIGALVGGNNLTLLKRERNENVIDGIKQKVSAFWKSIDENKPPEPDFASDSSFINELYGYSEPGKFIDETDNAIILEKARRYKEFADQEKVAVKNKKAIKAELLTMIGDAEKVEGGLFSISAGTVGPAHIEYERKGYRNFRINWRK